MRVSVSAFFLNSYKLFVLCFDFCQVAFPGLHFGLRLLCIRSPSRNRIEDVTICYALQSLHASRTNVDTDDNTYRINHYYLSVFQIDKEGGNLSSLQITSHCDLEWEGVSFDNLERAEDLPLGSVDPFGR